LLISIIIPDEAAREVMDNHLKGCINKQIIPEGNGEDEDVNNNVNNNNNNNAVVYWLKL